MVERPRLRALEAHWTTHQGNQVLLLSDRLGLMRGSLVVPASVGLLLSLCDGSRDLTSLGADYAARTGEDVPIEHLTMIIAQLDEALVFEGPRFESSRDAAITAFRSEPHRRLFHAGAVYPDDRIALQRLLDGYGPGTPGTDTTIRGVISPHIDYARGGSVYGALWAQAAASAREADVVLVFGTDHHGDLGQLTVTDRPYATPFGILPAVPEAVAAVAAVLGDDAYVEELHHRSEHSIELAAVWLHWALGGASKPLIPILCGSFAHFTRDVADPATDGPISAAIRALRHSLAGRRVLAVAAADLAHVGPAFGDPPFRRSEQRTLADADRRTLQLIAQGDAGAFFADLRAEQDQRKYCGLPPIYLLLRFLAEFGDGPATGELVSYEQCPADTENTSWVSIAGVLLR